MPGKILGLDISENWITAVQVKSGLKGYEITACSQVMIEGNDGLNNALKGLFEQTNLKSDLCIASIPGEHISYRNLEMPFKDPKKIRQTLPFEIETMVPFPINDLLVDFTIIDRSDGNDILAASVKKSFISEYLGRLQNYGIDPEVLDIRCVPIASWLLKQAGTPENGLILEIGEKRVTMVSYLRRRIALIRTFTINGFPSAEPFSDPSNDKHSQISGQIESCFESFCATVQNSIHAYEWQGKNVVRPEKVFFTGVGALYPDAGRLLNRFLGIPSEMINLSKDKRIVVDENVAQVWNPALMDSALALALRDARKGLGFNFRKDDFEIKREYYGFKKELRKVAVFLIVIFCFLVADMCVDYYSLKRTYSMLDHKITEVFKQALPEVTRIVDPVQQMKVKINEIKKSTMSHSGMNLENRVLDLLRDISKRVPKSLDVKVTRMAIDPEAVRVSGNTDTFNTVDNIKSGLESSKYFSSITISSANLDKTGKRVQFEMKLQRAK